MPAVASTLVGLQLSYNSEAKDGRKRVSFLMMSGFGKASINYAENQILVARGGNAYEHRTKMVAYRHSGACSDICALHNDQICWQQLLS
ncbi:MAG: hypothetical protein A3E57_06695 [Candidatus Muproteobacteria bacterium RIFCSPHIGHO2_12_FULL_60_33]|nr:MAG: hypothetical protein A3D32_03120 [Candidatus Muproteobacteria bacterium RIFCSPHIGHO2_02_FULL_60_13]OGI56292.1 MAG: hypothetical protein A3E57_06695 [Candidatus Muproteobacteria bacterium RIFCSPHIGHO2_12_FULL_60_33]